MPARPHLQIYGYPHLRDASGQPVGLRTRKQLALLVYLALEARDRPVSRDVLVDLFWSDVPAARGRHSLSQALTAIRQALGRDAVAGGAGAVRLTADLATDLDGAVNGDAGAGGPDLAAPLRELESAGGPAFAHWVDASRERCLRLARAGVLEQLQEARAAGAMARVHERAAVLYRVDPFSDAAVHALAEGLLLHGDTPGAIRLLRRHVERARRALGCNPHPDVERLLKRVEDGRVPAPFPEAAMQRAHPRRREVFVGREVELARLESEWTEARGGRVRTFLVGGPAGIGKSSLIRRFATSVAARADRQRYPVCGDLRVDHGDGPGSRGERNGAGVAGRGEPRHAGVAGDVPGDPGAAAGAGRGGAGAGRGGLGADVGGDRRGWAGGDRG